MKAGIHPDYAPAKITCACGRATETYSTVGEIHVEICSHCHPFFTGRQKLVDTAGRVERFKAKYGGGAGGAKKAAKGMSAPPEEVVAAAEPATESVKEAPAAEEALVDEPVTEAEALAADATPAVEASQDDGSTDGVDEGEPETAAAES